MMSEERTCESRADVGLVDQRRGRDHTGNFGRGSSMAGKTRVCEGRARAEAGVCGVAGSAQDTETYQMRG
jgi:hypothetical protein